MARAHPQLGQVRIRTTDGAHRAQVDAANAGRSLAQALLELPAPDGIGGFYQSQYEALIADWPHRQAFLSERGCGTQLADETALVARLEELLA
jgi:hypothetical protein